MAEIVKVNYLSTAIFGSSDPMDIDDANCDGVEDLDLPFTKFFEKARFDKAMAQSSSGPANSGRDEVVDAIDKRNEERPAGTLAKKLGVTRYEVVRVGGERWSHGYNDRGELVAARLLTP